MIRRVFFALLIAVCALAQAALCISEETSSNLSYRFEISVRTDAQALIVHEEVRFVNSSSDTLDRLIFSVPANCFRRESTLPYDNALLESAFPAGYAPGGIEFSSVIINGTDAEWAVQGENECYLRVKAEIAPGECASVQFDFTVLLSDNCAFLGAGDRDWRVSQFYPALCAYENGQFETLSLSRAGEWRYASAASFSAVIETPADFEVACGGRMVKSVSENGVCRYTAEIENARDFSFALSRRFHCAEEKTASGTAVRIYGQRRNKLNTALEAAVRALERFEEWFGVYPYECFSIIESQTARPIHATALSFLEDGAFQDAQTLANRVYFCVARQYFQEIVHANPALEPWLFEGLSQYGALILVDEFAGANAFSRAVDEALRPALQVTVPGGLSVDSASARFATQREYEIITRERGAAVLYELSRAMGKESLLDGLSVYVRENRFKTVTAVDFADALAKATGRDWEDALVSWLYTIDEYTNAYMEFYE